MAAKRISIATEAEIMEALKSLQEGIVFHTREKEFSAVEVRFAREELAVKHATIMLKTVGEYCSQCTLATELRK